MGDVYGVTPAGFVAKPLAVCLSELVALARASFGAGIKVNASSKWGQFLGILSERESEIWDKLQAVHVSRDPDQAGGSDLDALCALAGIVRRPARASRIPSVLCGGVAGTVIPAGRAAVVSVTRTRFEAEDAITLAPADAWSPSTEFGTLGAVVTSNGNLYRLVVAGMSAEDGGGPAGVGDGPDSTVVDGTCTWAYFGPGDGTGTGAFVALESGPLPAPAASLDQIETPVNGWTCVRSLLDATLGRDMESDANLRVRREQELAIAGGASPDAIRAEVSRVDGVTSVRVFYNDDDAPNADGLPPHSIEVLVAGGSDEAVAAAIHRSKAAGIASAGGVAAVVVDASGNEREVRFSRPVEVPIWVTIAVETNEDYPAGAPPFDGDSLVAQAIALWGQRNLRGGVSLYPRMLVAPAGSIAGVYNVPQVRISTEEGWLGEESPIEITSRQIAVLDTSRITVVHGAIEPM